MVRLALWSAIALVLTNAVARAQPSEPSVPNATAEPESPPAPPSQPAPDEPVTAPSEPVVPAVADEPTEQPSHAKKRKKKKKSAVPKITGYMQVFFRGRIEASADKDADGNKLPNTGDSTKDPTDFRVQRVRLEVKGKLNKYVKYDVEIDPRAPEITGILRDAFLSISKIIPHHQIRIGQQKTQFGYEHVESSTRLYTVNRAEVSDNLMSGVNGRDIGIGLIGRWPTRSGITFEDAVTVVNGNGLNTQSDDTHRKNVWGRIGASYEDPAKDLLIRAGVSAGYGDQVEPEDPGPPASPGFLFTFKRLGFDLEIDHKYAWLAAEYVTGSDDVTADPDLGGSTSGWYALAAGKIAHDAGPVVRYDVLDEFHRLTLGGFWGGPEKPLRVLVNYEIYEDEIKVHDHRYYLWVQGRF